MLSRKDASLWDTSGFWLSKIAEQSLEKKANRTQAASSKY